MGHHHKAASCSAIPSFQSFTSSVSTSTTQTPSLNLFDAEYTSKQQQQPHANVKKSITPTMTKSNSQQSVTTEQQQAQLFPLPSFCLYSRRALANEYAPESDIIQFLSPVSTTLEERLPMFVGVLQSLFTVVNDMPFLDDQDSDNDDDDDEDEDDEDEEEEDDTKSQYSDNHKMKCPFTVIGLSSMKLVVWNNMYDNIVDMDIYEKDLCLVVMISSQVTDNVILKNMEYLRENVVSSSTAMTVTANQMGEQLIPLIDYLFDSE